MREDEHIETATLPNESLFFQHQAPVSMDATSASSFSSLSPLEYIC